MFSVLKLEKTNVCFIFKRKKKKEQQMLFCFIYAPLSTVLLRSINLSLFLHAEVPQGGLEQGLIPFVL
jgi:hypothetical protein